MLRNPIVFYYIVYYIIDSNYIVCNLIAPFQNWEGAEASFACRALA